MREREAAIGHPFAGLVNFCFLGRGLSCTAGRAVGFKSDVLVQCPPLVCALVCVLPELSGACALVYFLIQALRTVCEAELVSVKPSPAVRDAGGSVRERLALAFRREKARSD